MARLLDCNVSLVDDRHAESIFDGSRMFRERGPIAEVELRMLMSTDEYHRLQEMLSRMRGEDGGGLALPQPRLLGGGR